MERADLRALLDAYYRQKMLTDEYRDAFVELETVTTGLAEALEANYAKFRRGVRGALGKPSTLAVSDQWIIDGVRELETVATGLAEALERITRIPGSYLSLGHARAALAAWKEYKSDTTKATNPR